MKNKKIFIAWAAAITATLSCSSPESDGRKAAQLYIDAENASSEYCMSEYTKLIEDFNPLDFTSRAEVSDKIKEISDNAEQLKAEKILVAQEFYNEKSGKYLTNMKKNAEFMYAFKVYKEANRSGSPDMIPLLRCIDSLRLTIIPSKPDLNKIKQDLVGRKISGMKDGYLGITWYRITDDCSQIKEAYVTYENFSGSIYVCDMHLKLQADGGAYEADIKAHYRLGDGDDWQLDMIESKRIDLVRTGLYDNCITARRTGWVGEYEVEFTNSCDAPLAVGGQVKYEYRDGWKKFCIIVSGNSSKRIGGLFLGSIADYRIDFVERP